MKKIFASDLDQTLIYSPKFVSALDEKDRERVVLIETKDNEPISYISRETIKSVKKFMEGHVFIPATTRTVEQYRRISLFKSDILPKYAVTSNGGNIIINGTVDEAWNEYIRGKIKNDSVSGEEVLLKFAEIKDESWTSECRVADNLFYYFIIDKNNYPVEKISIFEKWLGENGWQFSVQGRKMYMIPKILDKWNAIKHIADKEKDSVIYAAGDSKLDWNMLTNADMAIAPLHGTELLGVYNNCKETKNEITITKNSGIFVSEEILNFVNYSI